MSIVKVQRKGQMTIPSDVRSAVGLADGDLVDVKAAGGKIILTPRLAIDRSEYSSAQDEYTAAQRRIIDRGIAKSLKEYRQGKFSGPFDTAEEFITDLHKASAKLNVKEPKPARR